MRSGIHGDPTDQLIRGIKHTWSEQINCDCTVVLRPAVARGHRYPGYRRRYIARYPFTRTVHVMYLRCLDIPGCRIPRMEQFLHHYLSIIFLACTNVSLFTHRIAVINQLFRTDIFLLIINNICYYLTTHTTQLIISRDFRWTLRNIYHRSPEASGRSINAHTIFIGLFARTLCASR